MWNVKCYRLKIYPDFEAAILISSPYCEKVQGCNMCKVSKVANNISLLLLLSILFKHLFKQLNLAMGAKIPQQLLLYSNSVWSVLCGRHWALPVSVVAALLFRQLACSLTAVRKETVAS